MRKVHGALHQVIFSKVRFTWRDYSAFENILLHIFAYFFFEWNCELSLNSIVVENLSAIHFGRRRPYRGARIELITNFSSIAAAIGRCHDMKISCSHFDARSNCN